MIIVVEGPDNAGKTTLATRLAKELKAIYLKAERPEHLSSLWAYRKTLDSAEYYSGTCIADRHPAISEPIYGTIIRGGHNLTAEEIRLCLEQIDIIVYCRPPNRALLETIGERSQMVGVVENSEAIIAAYDRFFKEKPPALIYNYLNTPWPEVLKVFRQ